MEKKLTDEQQNLLKFLQKWFEGTKLDKPTMDVFCCCNQSAIEKWKTNNNNKNNINFNYSTNTNSTVDYTDIEK